MGLLITFIAGEHSQKTLNTHYMKVKHAVISHPSLPPTPLSASVSMSSPDATARRN